MQVEYVRSGEQLANILMEALDVKAFEKYVGFILNSPCKVVEGRGISYWSDPDKCFICKTFVRAQ